MASVTFTTGVTLIGVVKGNTIPSSTNAIPLPRASVALAAILSRSEHLGLFVFPVRNSSSLNRQIPKSRICFVFFFFSCAVELIQ